MLRRAFLAALPEAAAGLQLNELQARLRPQHPGLRWIDAGDLHLTLRFLGDIDAAQAQAVESRLDAWAGAGAIELTGAAVEDWHGRVLVATYASTALIDRLVGMIEREVRALGFSAEPRAFRPHVTLARGRADTRSVVSMPAVVPTLCCDRIGLLARAEAGVAAPRYRVVCERRLRA